MAACFSSLKNIKPNQTSGNRYAHRHLGSNLKFVKRGGLVSYFGFLKYKGFMDNLDKWIANRTVRNFNIMNHKMRGDNFKEHARHCKTAKTTDVDCYPE